MTEQELLNTQVAHYLRLKYGEAASSLIIASRRLLDKPNEDGKYSALPQQVVLIDTEGKELSWSAIDKTSKEVYLQFGNCMGNIERPIKFGGFNMDRYRKQGQGDFDEKYNCVCLIYFAKNKPPEPKYGAVLPDYHDIVVLPYNEDTGEVGELRLDDFWNSFFLGELEELMKVLGGLRTVRFSEDAVGEFEEGFLTSHNRYVGREEAAKIAYERGQIEQPTKSLYSEDLHSEQ
jgi:hypothetical protein